MILTLVAPVVAAAVLAAFAAMLWWQRSRQRRLVGSVVEFAPLGTGGANAPTLLYFTGAACTICHTAQRPAIAELAAAVGSRATIREVDVAREPELARRYRVMSLPTTVVIRLSGEVAAVNVGFAGAQQLEEQLATAGLAVA